jgi:hypothetical protein
MWTGRSGPTRGRQRSFNVIKVNRALVIAAGFAIAAAVYVMQATETLAIVRGW